MSNIIVEGFGSYGVGGISTASSPVALAMLSGAWAQFPLWDELYTQQTLGTLPWDADDDDLYLGCDLAQYSAVTGQSGWRRVLPAASDDICFSFYFAVANLPAVGSGAILTLYDSSRVAICRLMLLTTGALAVASGSGTVLAQTQGPVLVAEAATHMEMHFKSSTGVATIYVGGVQVLTGSGLAFSNANNFAQFSVMDSPGNVPTSYRYMGHLIVRDGSTIVGDRKVATLLVNADDPAHQGWTPEPLQRFGIGILDNAPTTAGVGSGVTTKTDIGAQDFTIETQLRFQQLPTGSNKAVIFGKWDEANNERSYQLYLGGPSLENGLLVFRTSTTGVNGTVVEKVTWPWVPQTGVWYHIAMCRSAGQLLLFINGVQQGIAITDGDTYFAGGARACQGMQNNGAAAVAGASLQGWFDELRLTIGLSRYNANFAPPTGAFPRGGDDPDWANVAWLSSWETGVVADDGPNALALTAYNGAACLTPNDGAAAYETLNKATPDDDTFIQAALVPATGTLTMTATPANNETVTLGTKDGTNAAVYTFVTALSGAAFEVLIGTGIPTAAANLAAAINEGVGEGTVYGTGTTANADATASVPPSNQVIAQAVTPGAAGNSIASTETLANGSWSATTLLGGLDIPSYSQFGFSRMPPGTTVVDSITISARQWKTDGGGADTLISLVGIGGGKIDGTAVVLANTPTLSFDTFIADPDTSGSLTPTTILGAKARINRTV